MKLKYLKISKIIVALNYKLILSFVFLLLFMPMALAINITDYNMYLPFSYTNLWSGYQATTTGVMGADGYVVANDSNVYNYGRNGSFIFDGSDDYVSITDGIRFEDNWTFSSWLKADVGSVKLAVYFATPLTIRTSST